MLNRFLFILICALTTQFGFSQNDYPYGEFSIREFKTDEYNGTAQNWDIIQNNEGFILVANSTGILQFDGSNWIRLKMDNQEDVRSLSKDKNGEIYIGGESEFGKLFYDSIGSVQYKSLSTSLKNHSDFKIWNTIHNLNQINFIAREQIFILNNDHNIREIKTPPNTTIDYSLKFNDEIICFLKSDSNEYATIFNGSDFIRIKNSRGFNPKGYFKINNIDYLVSTKGIMREIIKTKGVYKLIDIGISFKTDVELDINCTAISKKIIAVGTHGDGIFLFNKRGKFIRAISEKEGLINKQIQSLHFDHNNNLWSANDNGIFLIDLSNPITTFSSKKGITSSIEDFNFTDSETYIGTHRDLYKTQIKHNELYFENTNIFKQEIYQIKDFTFSDGQHKKLLIANKGIYSLEGNGNKLIEEIWAWDLFQSKSNPDKIWVGLDGDGIGALEYSQGKFTYQDYPSTSGDVRKVVEFENKLYYAVKNEGIHILDTTRKQSDNVLKGLIKYKDTTSIYQQFTLEICKNKLFVGTDNGLYIVKGEKLEPFNYGYNKERLKFHRLLNDNNEKLWFVIIKNSDTPNEQPEVGYIDLNSSNFNYISSPFVTTSEELIQVIDMDYQNNVWFGGVSNIYVFNSKMKLDSNDSLKVFISKFKAKDSTLLHYYYFSDKKVFQLDYEFNTISINFTTPDFQGNVSNTYSYYLEGLDTEWSDYTSISEKEYPRLHEGTYTFHVKSKNYYNIESQETLFTFTILPPWYRSWWAYIIYFILFITLIFTITKLSIKRVKDQNEKLEKIVEERTAEVESQKEEIEEKNKDIVDSIIYAKRIQNTILPTEVKLDKILQNYFIIYKPKDIVSGDFYWADKLDGKSYFSAIDCTGHGVPGAFVSIVGFNGLKRTVNEFKLRQPGQILDKLTDIVVDTFTASEAHLKDGMDMSLCSINYDTLELEFAGANNPLILIRNGEIIETKGNKQPIGDFEHRTPFTNHKIQLQKDDCIFLFTDGYADQFGGPKGKKFKLKTLKNLLLSISTKPIDEQKTELETAFNNWMGDLEQLDDVCLIGVKI